ncbi:hypothetical protein WJX75_009076 [Coccomyxa subellipsoidea]|uniref:Uncharacterized protein n=1 Tax=Coccomyxa subellipsoidea TaxID=248742 RepID=A0ABR2YIM1_9CHLO
MQRTTTNSGAESSGLKELKKAAKRKRLRLALGISKKDYNSAQLMATYKKYLTPLMVPATEGEMVVGASLAVNQAKAGSGNDGSGSADGAVTEGEANGEPSADNQAEAGSDDGGRSSADGSAVPASAEVEVCPTAHRLTVRQLASGPDPSVHCPQAENTTMVPASRTRAAAAAVSNTAVAAAVSDVHVQAAAGH